jgi:hypothetical protein
VSRVYQQDSNIAAASLHSPMVRIAVSLAAYQALASTLAEGREARPPVPLEVGEGVGMWIDHAHSRRSRPNAGLVKATAR